MESIILKQPLKTLKEATQEKDERIEIQDRKGDIWTFLFTKHCKSGKWWLDWEVWTPDETLKYKKDNDHVLAKQCEKSFGLIDLDLLAFQFKWYVNHYTNFLDLEILKREQKDCLTKRKKKNGKRIHP